MYPESLYAKFKLPVHHQTAAHHQVMNARLRCPASEYSRRIRAGFVGIHQYGNLFLPAEASLLEGM